MPDYALLSLLSLDGVSPLLSRLGMPDDACSRLRQIAREYLSAFPEPHQYFDRERSAEESADLTRVLHAADERADEALEAMPAEVHRVLTELAIAARPNAETVDESDWGFLFWVLVYGHATGHRVEPLGVDPEAERTVRDAVARHLPEDEYESDLEAAKQGTTRWDLWLRDQWAASGLDPYDSFSVFLDNLAARRIWRNLREELAAHHQRAIVDWANRQQTHYRHRPRRELSVPDWG